MPDEVNWTKEETESTGTGDLTLSELSAYRAFSDGFSTGGSDVFFYHIRHTTKEEMEYGTGHLSDSTTLVRDTVIVSTNSNNAVDFSGGTKEVVCEGGVNTSNQREFGSLKVTSGDILDDQSNTIFDYSAQTIGDGIVDSGAIQTDAVTTTEASFTDQQLGTGDSPTFSGGTFNGLVSVSDSNSCIIGHDTALNIGSTNGSLQLHGTTIDDSSLSMTRWEDNAGGQTFLTINKSRGSSVNTNKALQSGDEIGTVMFQGDDGSSFNFAARLNVVVDNSVADGQVPGRYEFETVDGSGNLKEAVRIDSNQNLKMQSGGDLLNAGKVQLNSTGASNGLTGPDQGGGTTPAIYLNSSGEWVAQDDSGNTTTLS